MTLIGIPVGDLAKARSGFSRGLGGGHHKYWKRVRVMRRGKLAWRYYYDTPADRKAWMEAQAKKVGSKRKKVAQLEEELHRDKADFKGDNPVIEARKELKELTLEYVTELLTWDAPPKFKLSKEAEAEYHQAMVDLYDHGEPDDPHGKPLSIMRALEMSVDLLPPSIKKNFSGAISTLVLAKTEEDSYLSSNAGVAGYCQYPKNPGDASKVVISLDAANGATMANRGHHMFGGLFSMQAIIHETAHAIHNQIGANRGETKNEYVRDDWHGPTFKDFEQWMLDTGRHENPVTPYAATNDKERWAESFTAALMYPRELAAASEATYEWFRQFFGEEAMRPLYTDKEQIDDLQGDRAKAMAADDLQKVREIDKKIDDLIGVLDMAKDDERLQWWRPKDTHVQTKLAQRLKEIKESGWPSYDAVDPPDEDTIPDDGFNYDRFYEVSIGGRTVFLRMDAKTEWHPDKPSPTVHRNAKGDVIGKYKLKTGDIKEVYDADGNILDLATAGLYLHQDLLTDDHEDSQNLIDFEHTSSQAAKKQFGDNSPEHRSAKVLGKYMLNKVLANNAARIWAAGEAGEKPDEGTLTQRPVEMTHREFRLRSGTFTFDRWGPPRGQSPRSGPPGSQYEFTGAGHEEYHALRFERDPKKRAALMDAFKKKQPNVAFHLARVTQADVDAGTHTAQQKGRVKGRVPTTRALREGEMPVPVLHSIRYINDNPDGTKNVIAVTKETEGANRGFYAIDNPIYRALLTPDGGYVKSAEHLEELCREASQAKRTTWVSVRADTTGGHTEHYYHLQVEFDGRGQPRILGDEWKRRLGKDEPRIDDLLSQPGVTLDGAETGRPQLNAEAIKMAAPPKKKKGAIPNVGEAVFLRVDKNEVDLKEKPEPGWDRMPDKGRDAEGKIIERPLLPEDPKGKRQPLSKQERDLKKRGLLPAFYTATRKQRSWFAREYTPLYDQWLAQKGKTIPAVLSHIIPAGSPEPAPGWDRMPEGAPAMPEGGKPVRVKGKKVKHPPLPPGLPTIKALKTQGLLPKHYTGTDKQRKWLFEHFAPAYKKWLAGSGASIVDIDRFVFVAAKGSGRPGRQITRWGKEHVSSTLLDPIPTLRPQNLEHDTLVYVHQEISPATGKPKGDTELRLLLPTDGSVDPAFFENVPGVTLKGEDDNGSPIVHVSLDGFARMREFLGGMSLTSEAEARLRAQTDLLREAAERARNQEHSIEVEDIDPTKLASGEVPGFGPVGLQPTLSDGNKFELALHQKELLQLIIDNGGRALGAHYMGTGKTVSAIAVAKMMHAMRDPTDPTKRHPKAPKKTLIVAPKNTIEQWRQAAYEFDEGATVVGTEKSDIPVDEYIAHMERYPHDIVVVGPEYFTINQAKLRQAGFDGLIVDEAHMGLKDSQAERNKVIHEWNPDMKLLTLLTGTPITTSPVDIMEYIKILSNGEQWAGMSKAEFTDLYLEESPIPGELGAKRKGPKIRVKPSKRKELAAIIAQWTHVAQTKDVKGKTLPAVRIEENQHAEMTGTQSILYSLYMSALSDSDRARLAGNAGTLSDDELVGLGEEARKQVAKAKAVANCLAYKPKSAQEWIMVKRLIPGLKGEKPKEEKAKFQTIDPDKIRSGVGIPKKHRKRLAGRWPKPPAITSEEAAVYNTFFRTVLGGETYESLAGTKITDEQYAAMKADGWPKNIKDPDYGPLGVRCRGADTPRRDPEYLARLQKATPLQRDFASLIMNGKIDPKTGKRGKIPSWEALPIVAEQHGVSLEEAQRLIGTRPDETTHSPIVEHGGVVVNEGETWFSDQRGSLHLPYMPEDWDFVNDRPKGGKYGDLTHLQPGGRVDVKSKYQPKPVLTRPPEDWTGSKKDWNDKVRREWEGPELVFAPEAQGPKGTIPVRRMDTGEIINVPKASVAVLTESIYAPGKRKERAKFDVAMFKGNAKAEELALHVKRFHETTETGEYLGAGEGGARQMVFFANGILDGCRTIEATLRVQGYKDVNEVLAGSPHYDPDDPNPGNGKYFVTYIGSTYTGSRELNAEIFKKRKDKLGRDLPESLFVHKTNTGRPWRLWPGADPHPSIKMSQWQAETRDTIFKQFGVRAPEAHFTDVVDGVAQEKFFYGSTTKVQFEGESLNGSEGILRAMVLTGDPTRIADPDMAEKARGRLERLQAAYERLVKAEATTDPPLSQKQEAVFNNCDFIVCSDAAQVGLNFGNAVEMVNFDTLGSPMREWQRITRSARMLPPAIKDKLKPIVEKLKAKETSLFQPQVRGAPEGLVASASIGGVDIKGQEIEHDGRTYPNSHSFEQLLSRVAAHAASEAAKAGATKKTAVAAEWSRIAAKARTASTLGNNSAIAFFEEMRETQAPGTSETVLDFAGSPISHDATAGTYDSDVVTNEAENAMRAAIQELDEADQKVFAAAGFVFDGDSNPAGEKNGGSLDAAGVYLAIRAQEILEYVEEQREIVSGEMRSSAAGGVVQDSDVMNAIIDRLSPEDRAILKTKKYLVNVRRLGVSAHVPEIVTQTFKVGNDEVEDTVMLGYRKQHPIETEANTRATQRARMTAVEALYAAVQARSPIRTELDYETATAADVGNMSRLDKLEKAQYRLGFRLDMRKANVW